MYRTQEEKQEYIEKIFNDRTLFEWEILHVSSHYDRLEIMQILAHTLVRDKLKYEINFLYIKDYKDFKFSQIINIIFHEIANEWVSFATDILYYPKKDAIAELHNKERVKFIHSLAAHYYDKYRREIFEEVADTFIELVSNAKDIRDISRLIEDILKSDLIKNRQILAMHDFSQLYSRVKAAQKIKSADILSSKMKIDEMKARYEDEADADEKQRLLQLLKNKKIEFEKLQNHSLDKFDSGVSRLKDTMVHSMIVMPHSS